MMRLRFSGKGGKGNYAMEELNSMTKEQMENELRLMRKKAVTSGILSGCAAVAAIFTIITEYLIVVVGFLVTAPVAGKLSGRAAKRSGAVKKVLGESVITDAIRDVLGDDVEYNPAGALAPGGVVVPFSYEHSSGSHHIKSVYTGVNIELGSIKLLYEHPYTQEETAEIVTDELVRFGGPWIICDFGKKPAFGVYIFEWTKKTTKL